MPAQGATPPRAARSKTKTPASKKTAPEKHSPKAKAAGPKSFKPSPIAPDSANGAAEQTPPKPSPPTPKKRKPIKRKSKPQEQVPKTVSPAKSRRQRKASDLLPHEVLLAVARGEMIADHVPTFEERVEAAKAAAPYFAPKGATTSKPVKTLAHEEALAVLDQAEPASPQLVCIIDGEGNDRQKT